MVIKNKIKKNCRCHKTDWNLHKERAEIVVVVGHARLAVWIGRWRFGWFSDKQPLRYRTIYKPPLRYTTVYKPPLRYRTVYKPPLRYTAVYKIKYREVYSWCMHTVTWNIQLMYNGRNHKRGTRSMNKNSAFLIINLQKWQKRTAKNHSSHLNKE